MPNFTVSFSREEHKELWGLVQRVGDPYIRKRISELMFHTPNTFTEPDVFDPAAALRDHTLSEEAVRKLEERHRKKAMKKTKMVEKDEPDEAQRLD